ncbi:hypothetical protein EXIGLDRAFT_174435 [Exidia glandulosa HHB12029]|uniref:Uncharacterized protein n=1 Tax=Exidia glandulosa HHB12029 TaxID=1314781 RepID=A0A165F741_EXIGL|nr:hypothetical protein EXIGLDRAFT_174435 [Exidia glandulosa HHB12029]
MFSFVNVLLAASLAVGIASGAAIPAANETLVERATPGVFFTADIHFQGAQKYFPSVPLNLCINMPSDFNRIASSWGPDAGLRCTAYLNPGCPADAPQAVTPKLTTQSPGIDDLTKFTWATRGGSGNWNDAISSFICSSI